MQGTGLLAWVCRPAQEGALAHGTRLALVWRSKHYVLLHYVLL